MRMEKICLWKCVIFSGFQNFEFFFFGFLLFHNIQFSTDHMYIDRSCQV